MLPSIGIQGIHIQNFKVLRAILTEISLFKKSSVNSQLFLICFVSLDNSHTHISISYQIHHIGIKLTLELYQKTTPAPKYTLRPLIYP